MKKKSPRSAASAAAGPQTAQLTAVRKLSRNGQHAEAETRLAALRARYPDFKPLLPLAWEVADAAGNLVAACLHAWEWSMASPNSLAAHEALENAAYEARMPALAALGAQKMVEAEGHEYPDPLRLAPTLTGITFEMAVQIELSQLFLAYGRLDDAIAALEHVDHPSARNNMAIAYFGLGDVAAAQACLEANLRQDKRNLFALHLLVRLQLWAGGYQAARESADILSGMQPRWAQEAYGKVFALLLMGAHDEVIAAWLAVADADFWGAENRQEHSGCVYLAGLATLREGHTVIAGEFFLEALDLDPGNLDAEIASEALMAAGEDGEADFKAGDFQDWLPLSWMTELQSARSQREVEDVFEAVMRRCDAHQDYLAIAAELGGPAVRHYAIAVLQDRALGGDAAAVDTLNELLVCPCGPDEVRLELELWLQQNFFIEAGKPTELLLSGEVQKVTMHSVALHSNQRDLGLPAAVHTQLEQTFRLLRKKDLRGALRLAEALAASHPGYPILVGTAAQIKEALGHDIDEIEALFQRAAALDPAYLFAQVGLARVAVRRGDLQAARALLKSVQGGTEYHFSEWRSILATERDILLAEGNVKLVRRVDYALEELARRFG